MDTHANEEMDQIRSGKPTLARLCISLPRDLYKRVKILAHNENTTISALMIEVIKARLRGE